MPSAIFLRLNRRFLPLPSKSPAHLFRGCSLFSNAVPLPCGSMPWRCSSVPPHSCASLFRCFARQCHSAAFSLPIVAVPSAHLRCSSSPKIVAVLCLRLSSPSSLFPCTSKRCRCLTKPFQCVSLLCTSTLFRRIVALFNAEAVRGFAFLRRCRASRSLCT